MKLCVMQCLQLIFNKLSKFIIDSPLQNRTIEDKKPLWVSCNNCGKKGCKSNRQSMPPIYCSN